MRKRIFAAALFTCLAYLVSPPSPTLAITPEFDQGPIVNITEENDFFWGTDRWNTQSARVSYLQADNDLPHWSKSFLNFVPALGFTPGAERIGYELGQAIFTPANTHSSELQVNDRPYAGWFYTGLVLQRRGVGLGDYLTLENFQVDIGIIGPEALGENYQTWFHHKVPQGWQYQLGDEPGIAVKYGRAWLIALPNEDEHYVDIIPEAGLSAGNVDTSFRAGTFIRAGYNMPQDFGVRPIESLIMSDGGYSPSRPDDRRWGFYAFTGVEGRAVLYTAFLDGNAFRDSHSVDKEPFVGEWRSGLVAVMNRVELAYTTIMRSREFKLQPEDQLFGSITLRVKF